MRHHTTQKDATAPGFVTERRRVNEPTTEDSTNWDAVFVKLPAAICGENGNDQVCWGAFKRSSWNPHLRLPNGCKAERAWSCNLVQSAVFGTESSWNQRRIPGMANTEHLKCIFGGGGRRTRRMLPQVSCLSSGAQVTLETDLEAYVSAGRLLVGETKASSHPGSATVFLREVRSSSGAWSREFYCEAWTGPSGKRQIVSGNNLCYFDNVATIV